MTHASQIVLCCRRTLSLVGKPTELGRKKMKVKEIRVISLVLMLVGVFMFVAGSGTYWLVSDQLKAERITVSDDSDRYAGEQVGGPFTAYQEALMIEKHALEATSGKTYAELDREDPLRAVAMNGSFLRASLFTSVVAFGVSALVIASGLMFILLGWALRRTSSLTLATS